LPSSIALCREQHAGQGIDTPTTWFRVGTVATGTAPAFGRALALCYGSDLLPLRLLFVLQLSDAVFHAAPSRSFHELCQTRSLPTTRFPLRVSRCARDLLVGLTHRKTKPRAGLTVAAITLWVTVSMRGSKLPPDLTRLFAVSNRSSPLSSFFAVLTGATPPEELVTSACQHDKSCGGTDRTSFDQSFPGCPGLSQSRSQRIFHSSALRLRISSLTHHRHARY